MSFCNKNLIIAVDGYSSCGKSTFAKEIAKQLCYTYVDSGAMYRAVTLFFLENGGLVNGKIIKEKMGELLNKIRIEFKYNEQSGMGETFLNGRNIEKEIRQSKDVANHVSIIAAEKEIRQRMVDLQRAIGQNKRIVMDGRDIGTVVFPNADIKIFMTASPEIRAQRRLKELQEKGIETNYEEVLKNLATRDYIDSHREESPLKKAPDALLLDNSQMTIPAQMEWFMTILKERTT